MSGVERERDGQRTTVRRVKQEVEVREEAIEEEYWHCRNCDMEFPPGDVLTVMLPVGDADPDDTAERVLCRRCAKTVLGYDPPETLPEYVCDAVNRADLTDLSFVGALLAVKVLLVGMAVWLAVSAVLMLPEMVTAVNETARVVVESYPSFSASGEESGASGDTFVMWLWIAAPVVAVWVYYHSSRVFDTSSDDGGL